MKLHRIIISSILCLAFLSFCSNKESKTISLTPKWKLGDSFKIKMVRNGNNNGSSNMGASPNLITECEFKITDTSNAEYKLQWIFVKSTVEGVMMSQLEPLQNYVITMYDGLSILFSLNKDGSYKSLMNYDELQLFVNKSLDSLLKMMAKPTDTEEQKVQTRQQALSMFDTKEKIEQSILKELRFYFNMYGVNIKNNNGEYSIDTSLTSSGLTSILDKHVASSITMKGISFNENSNLLNIKYNSEANSQGMIEAMNQILKTNYSTKDKIPEELKDVYVHDENNFIYNTHSGLFNYIENKRIVGVKSNSESKSAMQLTKIYLQ